MSFKLVEAHPRLSLTDVPPCRPVSSLLEDARRGLLEPPRSLPPKYFYDERGSDLFDQICLTDEYYPTRTEGALLASYGQQIIDVTQPDHIIELGSGTCRKTRHLLDAWGEGNQEVVFWPFDVCGPMLAETSLQLAHEYDWLAINALVGDYSAGLAKLPNPEGRRLYLFLGGTIGNFQPDCAVDFLHDVASHMRPGDYFLLGADRVKSPEVLEAAYNDATGVTAAFNLNLLNVLNRDLEADFDPRRFSHRAVFNSDESRIEMHLVAEEDHPVTLGELDTTIQFSAGEHMLTEISRKFTADALESLLSSAGMRIVQHYEPQNNYFSLVLAERQAAN